MNEKRGGKRKLKGMKVKSSSDGEPNDFESELKTCKQTKTEKKDAIRRHMIVAKFEEEQRLCDINMKKVRKKWEKFLSETKLDELNLDWEALKEEIYRCKDFKDTVIQLLMEELDEVVESKWKLSAAFISAMDRLLGNGEARIKRLRTRFMRNVDGSVKSWNKKEIEIEEKQKKALENLQLTIFQQGESANIYASNVHVLHDEAVLNLKSEYWVETERMESEIDETMEWLIIRMQTEIITFLYFTKYQRVDFEALRKRDEAYKKIMEKDYERCKTLREEIKILNKKLDEVEEKNNEVATLKLEKNKMLNKYRVMQWTMKTDIRDDEKKLQMIINFADDSIKDLQRKLSLMNCILELKRQCKYNELKDERITIRSNLFQGLASRGENRILNGLLEHVGKVKLSSTKLHNELTYLRQENFQLRQALGGHFRVIKSGMYG